MHSDGTWNLQINKWKRGRLRVHSETTGNDISNCNENQSADSTLWTGFLMVFSYYTWYCANANQPPTPKLYYMQEFQDSLIQCSTSRVFVSIPIPWMYEQQKRFNIHQCFDISRGLWDRVRQMLITVRDRELVPHVCFTTLSNNVFRLDMDCHLII